VAVWYGSIVSTQQLISTGDLSNSKPTKKNQKLEFKNVGKKIIAIKEWWVDFFGYLKIR
jgi:hypothetical protein